MGSELDQREWSLFTFHAQLLWTIAENPTATIRELAQMAEISQRSAHLVLRDLVQAGYVDRKRVGRRNNYVIEKRALLEGGSTNPIGHRRVQSFVALVLQSEPPKPQRPQRSPRRATRSNK